MSREEIFNILSTALCDIFDVTPDEIGEDTDLVEELFADEYDYTELSMIIEEEFGLTLKKLSSLNTVGEITDEIADKIED